MGGRAFESLVDVVGWRPLDDRWIHHERHVHDRLITSIVLEAAERREVADALAAKPGAATVPTALLLPLGGVGEWDRAGAPLHRPDAHRAFRDRLRDACPGTVDLHALDAHINDEAFAARALAVFDAWLADGTVARPRERRPTGAQPGVRAPAVNATSHSGRPPSKRPTR